MNTPGPGCGRAGPAPREDVTWRPSARRMQGRSRKTAASQRGVPEPTAGLAPFPTAWPSSPSKHCSLPISYFSARFSGDLPWARSSRAGLPSPALSSYSTPFSGHLFHSQSFFISSSVDDSRSLSSIWIFPYPKLDAQRTGARLHPGLFLCIVVLVPGRRAGAEGGGPPGAVALY